MAKKYRVRLTEQERGEWEALIRKGKAAARTLAHARVLLQADEAEGATARAVHEGASGLNFSPRPGKRIRQRFVEQGLEAALQPKPTQRLHSRALDGVQEAHLMALTCSAPPEGKRRWSLRLWAERMVELKYPSGGCPETVRRVPKKNVLKPHLRKRWCIPPKASAEFVPRLEDVGEGYHRPYDPRRLALTLDVQAAHRRGARAATRGPRASRAVRERVCPSRGGEPISCLRAAGGLAQRSGHRHPHPERLGLLGGVLTLLSFVNH